MNGVLWWLALFWMMVHVLNYFFISKRTNAYSNVLPLTYRDRVSSRFHFDSPPSYKNKSMLTWILHPSRTTVAIRDLRITIHTTSLNSFSLSVADKLSNDQVAFAFYDIGSAFCATMSLFSVAWLSLCALGAMCGKPQGTELSSVIPRIKWLPESLIIGLEGPFSYSGLVVSPLPTCSSVALSYYYLQIPGVTVPGYHLLILVVLGLACLLIHEAGHGIAASLDSVQINSTGIGMLIAIPWAYVSLPSSSVSSLPARARLRIASAGALHNFL